ELAGLGVDGAGGASRGIGRTGGQHDVVPVLGELTADLAADPAVATGHQRDTAHFPVLQITFTCEYSVSGTSRTHRARYRHTVAWARRLLGAAGRLGVRRLCLAIAGSWSSSAARRSPDPAVPGSTRPACPVWPRRSSRCTISAS